MRSSKSRSRNKNNRSRSPVGNVVNRVFDSNGPEGKVRGTPQQIIDKYNQLARDSALGNDRVATENFQQHAEHYLRMLSEAQKDMDSKREQQERENRDRQAQRDRERSDRDGPVRGRQDGETRAEGYQPDDEQPDIVDLGSHDDEGPGLVETPESRGGRQPEVQAKTEDKPKKPRAPRKPRVRKPVETTQGDEAVPARDASAGDSSDAAE